MRALRILRRAVALRCPHCGMTPLFTGWFRMPATCEFCGLRYERAQGYWVGAIYVNYAVTTTLAVLGFFLTYPAIPMHWQLLVWGAFVIAFPLWFFRYSRSLWLAVELLINPEL